MKVVKNEIFQQKIFDIFLMFAQNIDCGYTLGGGSNEYPQSMCWCKNKKNRHTPANSIFFYIKVGINWYTFHGHVFLMFVSFAVVYIMTSKISQILLFWRHLRDCHVINLICK